MAEKKMTNVDAMVASLELAKNAGMDELTAKLERMIATATKPRKKPTGKSKTRLGNEAAARELVEALNGNTEPFGTEFIMEHVKYVTSAQKASAVVSVAIDLGLIEKVENEKGKARYKLA